MTQPAPGFYSDLSREDYDAWDAINFSVLKWMHYSPAHARQQQLHPPEPTEALLIGQALHTAVLEPERWKELYVCGPMGDRRTKDVKAEWQRLEKEHPKAEVMRPKQHADIERLAQTIRSVSGVHTFLGGAGQNEVSFCWEDPNTKLLCKGRIDRITQAGGWTAVVDLKSTLDARPFAFAASCARYFYHVQAAWYLDGLNAVAQHERRFIFIAAEKKAPFATQVYELGSASIELGRRKWREWLDGWFDAVEQDIWHGYPDRLTPIELPEWAWKDDAPSDLGGEEDTSSPF